MANYIVSDTNLTAVANAIRTKGGTSEQLEFPDDFVSAIGDIQTGGGGTDTLLALENNTLTSWTSTAAKIQDRLFYEKSALLSVSYPNATNIGEYCFYQCTGLQTASFPEVTETNNYAFYRCRALTSIQAPKLKTIRSDAFRECSGLAAVNFGSCTQLYSEAFYGCSSLESVEFNSDMIIMSGSSAVFRNCAKLPFIDLKNSSQVGANTFNGCTILDTVVLRRTSLCTLSNINAFTGTPFASDGTGGTLYVPQDLIASYQSASNWSTILGYANNQIKAIEGSAYE